MKFTTLLLFCLALSLQMVTVLSAALPGEGTETSRPSDDVLAIECGDLGVMPVPEGADPREYRHCLEHPASLTPMSTNDTEPGSEGSSNNLALAQACNRGSKTYGRDKHGYCWKECAMDGKWCWLADDGGTGSWARATEDVYCLKDGYDCAKAEPGKPCSSCGCSC